jgi:para-nitrobenzyl esterase
VKPLLLLLLAIAGPVAAQTVIVDAGQIEGASLTSGVRAWFGVPFAAPPVRELRWKAPQPVKRWSGIYHANRPAPMCLQPLRNRTMNHYFGNEATSEDCLYLNIWAPKSGANLPVIVWIYGGGFNVGSASMANYSGEGLAAKGVVQVNLAYRVGVMGFLAHPELTKEGGGASGNYGLMDQIAALKWVQRNIAAFGGDPGNVTIAGQSAGSMSVALLQQSPMAKGLFHRIVGMSGSPFGELLSPLPLSDAEAQGLNVQAALGASGIEAMRDMSGDRVIALSANVMRDPVTIDGDVLAASPQATFAAKTHSDVPIMIGFTRDEAFANFGPAKTVADYQVAVRRAFPATAVAVLKAYPVRTDSDVLRALTDLQRDASVGRQMAGWARAQQKHGKMPAYAWFFSRRQPYATDIKFSDHDPATVGAYHTGDVPYWLNTLDSLNLFRTTRLWTTEDRALATAMSDMLITFAKFSVPSVGWPKFDPKRPRVIQLDLDRPVIDWPNCKTLDLLKAAPLAPTPQATPRIRD